MSTALRVLVDTRALLSKRVRWAKDAQAYDLRNHMVSPTSPAAVRWSLLGALAKATEEGGEGAYVAARSILVDLVTLKHPRSNLQRFNEMASHEELLCVLDFAIGLAETRALSGTGRPIAGG